MWLLCNKLFGWHYVEYRDSACTFVARVIQIPNGHLRMKCGSCRSHYNAILNKDGTFIGKTGRWIPLTWNQLEIKELTTK